MTKPMPHLRGQYLVVRDTAPLQDYPVKYFGKNITWNDYTVFADSSLPITTVSSAGIDALLIGYMVHHEHNDFSNDQLLSWVINQSRNTREITRLLQDCGGRYVALLQDASVTIAITDACAMRQVYWYDEPDQLMISSSAKLILDALGFEPRLNETLSKLVYSDGFKAREYAWYGDRWIDMRIKKVLANHYLDMKKKEVRRTDYHYAGPTEYCDIIGYAAKIMTGLVSAIHSRCDIVQPLTAGYDSRLILAASRNFSQKTQYYIFDLNHELGRASDINIAARLCEMLDLNFKVIIPAKLRDDFVVEYGKKCFFPRILPKTVQIQWHFDNNRDRQIMNLNGNCGEVVRYYYQNIAGRSVEAVNRLTKKAGFNGFFAPVFNEWYTKANDFCKNNHLDVYDLFYWEQRMSNWGAMYPFDQDIAIEEFTPYNHKNLLLALLHVDIDRRKGPQYQAVKDIIKQLWPEVLSLPFNPIIGLQFKLRAKSYIKRLIGKK